LEIYTTADNVLIGVVPTVNLRIAMWDSLCCCKEFMCCNLFILCLCRAIRVPTINFRLFW